MTVRLSDFKKELIREGRIKPRGLMLAKIKMMLSELLCDLRNSRKMSQKELARAVGVSQPYIAKIESGEENLTVETIAKILAVLDMSLTLSPRKRTKNGEIFHIAKAA